MILLYSFFNGFPVAASENARAGLHTLVTEHRVYSKKLMKRGYVAQIADLKWVTVKTDKPPITFIYDPYMVFGRPVLSQIGIGEPLRFKHFFTRSQLLLANQIKQLQERPPLRPPNIWGPTNPNYAPVIRYKHNVRAGHIIRLSDLSVEAVPESRLPASGVQDIWTALGRKCLRTAKAGEQVEMLDVIPGWAKFYFDDSASGQL